MLQDFSCPYRWKCRVGLCFSWGDWLSLLNQSVGARNSLFRHRPQDDYQTGQTVWQLPVAHRPPGPHSVPRATSLGSVCPTIPSLVGLLGSWTDQVGGGRRVCFSQMATQTAVKEDKALVTTRERAQDQFALSFSSSASSEVWWGSCFSGPQGAESQHSPPCVTASPNRLGAPLGQGPCLTPLSAQRGIWHLLMLSEGFRKCKEFVSKL